MWRGDGWPCCTDSLSVRRVLNMFQGVILGWLGESAETFLLSDSLKLNAPSLVCDTIWPEHKETITLSHTHSPHKDKRISKHFTQSNYISSPAQGDCSNNLHSYRSARLSPRCWHRTIWSYECLFSHSFILAYTQPISMTLRAPLAYMSI